MSIIMCWAMSKTLTLQFFSDIVYILYTISLKLCTMVILIHCSAIPIHTSFSDIDLTPSDLRKLRLKKSYK